MYFFGKKDVPFSTLNGATIRFWRCSHAVRDASLGEDRPWSAKKR
jgi:hypothetical protein